MDSLRQLVAFSNTLDSLPASIGKLAALKGLRVEDNRLTYLPPGILALAPAEMLDVSGNRICSPPESIAAWIDRYSGGLDWRSSQTLDGTAPCRPCQGIGGTISPTPERTSWAYISPEARGRPPFGEFYALARSNRIQKVRTYVR